MVDEVMKEELRLVSVRPSQRQIAYQQMEFNGFIHFTVNTFTGKEWGTGQEVSAIFDPEELDARQWVETAKNAGMKGIILTCKHHDGFCLWPSAHTCHSIEYSPYKGGQGDLVKEVSEACREFGIKFGVYLSPWDRNHYTYGMGKAYDDYFVNQLTELLTRYGKIFAVWLDGACGEGANGKVQEYDWERYYETVRSLQPEACIAISGPDIRWCGNEAGMTRESEWSVVPAKLAEPKKIAEDSQQEDNAEFREKGMDPTQMELGTREKLKDEQQLIYYPAETDLSIRPGWFYHEEEDKQVRSFEELRDIYLKTVGGNAVMLLNIPPDKRGLIHDNDVEVLKKLGAFIRDSFAHNLADRSKIITIPPTDAAGRGSEALRSDDYESFFANAEGEKKLQIDLIWEKPEQLSYLVLKENILFSQRIEQFEVFWENALGEWETVCQGTVVGYKKIISLNGLMTKKLRIIINDARVAPVLSFVGAY
ncbi:MAG: alpha-L-fucosidase [Lachnospiraceae bacterium]|nr:alpha-L-fucosidase [Lachnospiraceae bacterium]